MNKNYENALKKIDVEKFYTIEEAIALSKDISFEKFDTTFELSMNLNLNTAHADQQLRGSLILPNGTGKTAKVLVIANDEYHEEAKGANADYVGGVELLEKIKTEN